MKNTARVSLGGQNGNRRVDGGDSSSSLSPYKRTILWKRLRKCDRDIAEIDKQCRWNYLFVEDRDKLKLIEKRKKLDEKRKKYRLQLKGYLL